VIESPSSKSAAAAGAGSTSDMRREFGRVRASLTPDPIALTAGAEADASGQDKTRQVGPVDFSAKAFVGPNATYYDDRWRWMEWQGRQQSWNWAAAAGFGAWLAYRRMHAYAAIYGVWLVLLLVLALSGTPLRLLALLQLGVALGLGLYGNTLYRQYFRQRARDIARQNGDHAERVRALATAGGVDRRALGVWLGLTVVLGAGLLALASSLGLEAGWTY